MSSCRCSVPVMLFDQCYVINLAVSEDDILEEMKASALYSVLHVKPTFVEDAKEDREDGCHSSQCRWEFNFYFTL